MSRAEKANAAFCKVEQYEAQLAAKLTRDAEQKRQALHDAEVSRRTARHLWNKK